MLGYKSTIKKPGPRNLGPSLVRGRFTPEEVVVVLQILAQAKVFIGTKGSSFSALAHRERRLGSEPQGVIL